VYEYFDPQEQGLLVVYRSLFKIFGQFHHIWWDLSSTTQRVHLMGLSEPLHCFIY